MIDMVPGGWVGLCIAIGVGFAIVVGFCAAVAYLGSPQYRQDHGAWLVPDDPRMIPGLLPTAKGKFLFWVPAAIVALLGLGVYYAFIK
jgi:hypothetical protein